MHTTAWRTLVVVLSVLCGCAPAESHDAAVAGVDEADDVLEEVAGGATDADAGGDASETIEDGRCPFQLGWTREVRGGLGGEIVRVNTLEPHGPGSLREALAAEGPRVIVFEVGGVIDLATEGLRIDSPFVTIAGQTAPSPGITLIRGGLSIATHDVVIQHLRVRPGVGDQSVGWEPDGITSDAGHDIIVDHCSVTWAVDENLSASGPRFEGDTPEQWRLNTSHRVTLSHNIIAEGLSEATHTKGEHSKGTLIHDNATDILVYANLYASNEARSPLFKGGARGAVVNNFVANPGRMAMAYTLLLPEWGSEPPQTGRMSIVGNVFRKGLDTGSSVRLLAVVGPLELYLEDNVAETLTGSPVELIGGLPVELVEMDSPPTWPEGLVAAPSAGLVETLLADVGARPWDRDAIDTRIVEQALAGTGRIIDHEDEGGGYPDHAPTSAPFVPTEWDACFERRSP